MEVGFGMKPISSPDVPETIGRKSHQPVKTVSTPANRSGRRDDPLPEDATFEVWVRNTWTAVLVSLTGVDQGDYVYRMSPPNQPSELLPAPANVRFPNIFLRPITGSIRPMVVGLSGISTYSDW